MWRREEGLRGEDILHALPLVCVMVLKDGVLVAGDRDRGGSGIKQPLSGGATHIKHILPAQVRSHLCSGS